MFNGVVRSSAVATPKPSRAARTASDIPSTDGHDDVLLGLVRAPAALLGAAGAIAFFLHPGGFREVHAFDIPAGTRPRLRRLFDRHADDLDHLEEGDPIRLLTFGDGFVAVLPLATREAGHVYGVWFSDRTHPLDPHEERTLEILTTQVASVLTREQTYEQRMQAAVTAERQRIARDMHDIVIQRIYAAGLQLKGMEGRPDSTHLRDELAGIAESLDFTIEDIRATIFDLTNGAGTNLADNVGLLVAEYDGLLQTPATVRLEGRLDQVNQVVSDHLLATLRELLSNVARHAGAATCQVSVSLARDEVALIVEDDGVGIAADMHRSGLENIRLRALLLAGTLEIGPGRQHGTRVVWRVPSPELAAALRP